jgi:hypothetical protein
MPLADRAVFQVDKAASQDQILLWHHRKCREDPAMDRHLRLCPRGNRKEDTESQPQPLHNFTGSERHSFRKDAHITSTFGFNTHGTESYAQQPADIIRLTLGQ